VKCHAQGTAVSSTDIETPESTLLQDLAGERLGPYNSFNPVSRTQIWQWCSAMGDRSPLYLDEYYQAQTEFSGRGAVAPPAMMQMWTMRDVNDEYAPGSTGAHPYQVMQDLERLGFPANVAVSYDISFHRYLVEGDRVHHYKTVVDISELKTTALGEGHFFTDRMEYLDQNGELFAEALITYFQYQPAERSADVASNGKAAAATPDPVEAGVVDEWQPDYRNLRPSQILEGDVLPELVIPISHKLIVAGAIATQDFVIVHHNAPAARAASMPDIFMNILTTCGLSARYLSDWAGPGSRLRKLKFRLMAPNTPGDSMTLQGRVTGMKSIGDDALATVEFAGINSLGPHVTGSATMSLARD
jgi:acyl dehydratase